MPMPVSVADAHSRQLHRHLHRYLCIALLVWVLVVSTSQTAAEVMPFRSCQAAPFAPSSSDLKRAFLVSGSLV